jgi:glycosyltransferase involved in cell wall biosynthesis
VNLLLLSPTFHPHCGGAESLADDLARLLVERGHAVTVLTASGEPADDPETRWGAQVLRIRYPRPHRPPFAAPLLLAEGLRMGRWHRRLLTAGAIDAVCIARVDESCRYVLALHRRLGFRLSLYLHGGEIRSLQRQWRRFRHVLRWAMREADVIVAVSEDLRCEAARFAPEVADRILLVPNGVDVAGVRAATPASWPRPYLLFAGRLEPVKNPAFLIEAFARASADVANLDLIIVGSGSEDRAIADLVEARGLGDRVHLLGGLPRERVYALMKGARCLVIPSLAEGHPLVVLEAWAAGIPVLASAVKGLRDLVHDDVGTLFPLADTGALARLIVRTATDPGFVAGLRAGVAAIDLRVCDIRELVDRHIEVIGGRGIATTRRE